MLLLLSVGQLCRLRGRIFDCTFFSVPFQPDFRFVVHREIPDTDDQDFGNTDSPVPQSGNFLFPSNPNNLNSGVDQIWHGFSIEWSGFPDGRIDNADRSRPLPARSFST